MEFLKYTFFDNTVSQYLLVVAVILFVLFFKHIISRYLASFISKMISNQWPGIKKEQLVFLIVNPLNAFLVITSTVIVLSTLTFPDVWNVPVFKVTLHFVFQKLGIALLILALVRLLSRILKFASLVLKRDHIEKDERAQFQLILFFKDFIKALIYTVGLIVLLKLVFEIDVRALLGGLGIAGAALALAGRESIENIIASFIIFLDKPFYTGDLVTINSYTGTVEKIGLRSTRIRTLNKTLITVPNKQMVDRVLDNLSFRTFRRAEITLELATHHNSETIKDLLGALKTIVDEKGNIITEKTFLVTDLKKDGITLKIELLTSPVPITEFNELKQEVLLEFIDYLQSQNIEFASGNNIIIQEAGGEAAPKPSPII